MFARLIGAIVAIFVAWALMDYVIHQVILSDHYEATKDLWRPMAEMNMGLLYVVSIITAAAFVLIYAWFISNKSIGRGLGYGVLFGIALGVGMGYGSYAVMPIPYFLAAVWFAGTVAELAVAGLLVGMIVKE